MQIILPHTVKPKWRCTVPTETGPCGAAFFDGQQRRYERHVIACAKAHEVDIEVAQAKWRAPQDFGWADPERIRWTDQHRQELIEGRKQI